MISREIYDLPFLRGRNFAKYFHPGGETGAVRLIWEYSIYRHRDMTFLKVYFTQFEKKGSNKFSRKILLGRDKIKALGMWFFQTGHRECRRKRRPYSTIEPDAFLDTIIRNKLVGKLRLTFKIRHRMSLYILYRTIDRTHKDCCFFIKTDKWSPPASQILFWGSRAHHGTNRL